MQTSTDFRIVQRIVREWRTLQRLLYTQRTQRRNRLAVGGGARASRLGSCQLDNPGRRSGNDVNLQTHPARITSLKSPCRPADSFMACCQSLSLQYTGCVLPRPLQLSFAVQSIPLRTELADAYIEFQGTAQYDAPVDRGLYYLAPSLGLSCGSTNGCTLNRSGSVLVRRLAKPGLAVYTLPRLLEGASHALACRAAGSVYGQRPCRVMSNT